jgi:hypothetical protein
VFVGGEDVVAVDQVEHSLVVAVHEDEVIYFQERGLRGFPVVLGELAISLVLLELVMLDALDLGNGFGKVQRTFQKNLDDLHIRHPENQFRFLDDLQALQDVRHWCIVSGKLLSEHIYDLFTLLLVYLARLHEIVHFLCVEIGNFFHVFY